MSCIFFSYRFSWLNLFALSLASFRRAARSLSSFWKLTFEFMLFSIDNLPSVTPKMVPPWPWEVSWFWAAASEAFLPTTLLGFRKFWAVPAKRFFSEMKPEDSLGCWKLTNVLPKSGFAPNLVATTSSEKILLNKYGLTCLKWRLEIFCCLLYLLDVTTNLSQILFNN